MTTWFNFIDTPPPGGVGNKYIGIWYNYPPRVHDEIAEDVHLFESELRLEGDTRQPPNTVRRYTRRRWYVEEAPRYWTHYTPPEENE